MPRKRTRNPDFIKGINYPLQTYAWSGAQWGTSGEELNGKRATDKSPMLITSQPPGAFAKNDTSWLLTFGASHDCVLSLFNGSMFFQDLSQMELIQGSVYRRSMGNADFNIYEHVDDVQQIQYVVGGRTASAGRSSVDKYGEVLNEARGIGMRVPLMAAGWGRTIGMRPTDPSPQNTRDNDSSHKLARETWKYGPVDLRWDSRRGVWAAWNDLIADHNSQGLGTLVFDTNPDDACGFPFLKGTLEDAWKIIVIGPEFPTGDGSDTEKSGQVATHLEHKWVQKEGDIWRWAPLVNTFIIHRPGAREATCGSEQFVESPQIEILTTTYFHLDEVFDGPICFTTAEIEDGDLVGCMKFDGATWVPAVPFDPCERVGFELGVLFDNDKKIAESVIEVCKLILDCCYGGGCGTSVDPDKARQAGEKSQQAADAGQGAEDSLGGINGGSPLGPGDTLGGPNDTPLTADGAAAMNDAIDAAESAYDAAGNANQTAADAANAAADAAESAQGAASDLATARAEADAARQEADAAAARAEEVGGNDPSTNEAAAEAEAAAQQAEADLADATSAFNEANDAAEAAQQDAADAHDAATEAQDAAEAARSELEDVASQNGQEIPEDVKNALDEADRAARDAEQARRDALLDEQPPAIEEQLADINNRIDDKCAEIANGDQANLVATAEAINDVTDAIGQSMQKALSDLVDSVNDLMGEAFETINDALSQTSIADELGFETLEVDFGEFAEVGGLEAPLITSVPPVCPISSTNVRDPGPTAQDPTNPSGGENPGGSQTRDRPQDTGDPSEQGPPGGPGSEVPPSGGDTPGEPPSDCPPPEAPPTCPIITIRDPCNLGAGGIVTFGPCPKGSGSGTPNGTPDPAGGDDPGDVANSPDGGIDGDGNWNPPRGLPLGGGFN